VSALLLAAASLSGAAHAQAFSAAAVTGAVTSSPIGLRPGARIAFEPTPSAALEGIALAGLEPWDPSSLGVGWEAGLGLSGRAWITGVPRDGLFLVGRVNAGVSGEPDGRIGPWVATGGGFGGRIAGRVNIEATVGPEWAAFDPGRFRTELSIGYVFDAQSEPRSGNTTRHRPRKPPGR